MKNSTSRLMRSEYSPVGADFAVLSVALNIEDDVDWLLYVRLCWLVELEVDDVR
jgi:hypothetical protein